MVRERGAMTYMNIPLLAIVAGLCAYGSIMVQSATVDMAGGRGLFMRQIIGIVVGVVAMAVFWAIDYRSFQGWVGPLVFLDALLIISPRIPGLGDTANGATSWLRIGSFRLFQPSEPGKLITIIVMAVVIASFKGKLDRPADIAKVLGILAIPIVLIMLQPDLGTGLVFVAIAAGMLLIGGLPARWFAIFAIVGVVLVGAVFQFHVLKKYQEDRLLVFVDPTRDPAGAGYNLEQSKIAIGSGQLTGMGLGSGTQSNLNFLPARQTDFIFSVLGEELGFVGALILLGLYLALLITALEIAASSKDLLGSLIAAGIIAMWLFQILENMGMTIGLMPITGIPLPYMSFGSSNMVTNLAATGMLLSVWARRYAT